MLLVRDSFRIIFLSSSESSGALHLSVLRICGFLIMISKPVLRSGGRSVMLKVGKDIGL